MHRPRKVWGAIALVTLVATWARAHDDTRVVARAGWYGPRTEVRYSRPTLKWEIWPEDPKDRVSGVDLKVDGKVVPAHYDEGQRAVLYTPASPMKPGTHKVECR